MQINNHNQLIMEGLHGAEPVSAERKAGRRWRKNAEVKISRLVDSELQPKAPAEPKELKEQNSVELRRRTPSEAHHLHGGLQPEVIGQVLITATEAKQKVSEATELSPAKHFEAKAAQVIETAAPAENQKMMPIDKYVETITRENLMELSSKIIVDGSSLRLMYENHLIGEKALRRLVAEHLKNGNVREALRREMVQHEIDFERDPQLRDRSHALMDNNRKLAEKLVEKSATPDVSQEEPSKSKQPLPTSRKVKAYQPQLYKSKVLDAVLYGIIGILLILVIVMAFSR